MRKKLQGSYTVEAALLMGILLAFLTAVIYLGFYLHDRAFLQGAAYETAVHACLHIDDGKTKDGYAQSLIAKRMLGTRKTAAEESIGEKTVSAGYTGTFQIPGFSRGIFGQAEIAVQAKVTLSRVRPSRRIQMIRGIAKVIGSVRRIRT